MASLNPSDPSVIKSFVESSKGAGYVLDFTDSTFKSFLAQAAGVDIYDKKYEAKGTSKGKRLSALLEIEDNQLAGKVLAELVNHWDTSKKLSGAVVSEQEQALAKWCTEISDRLLGKAGKPVSGDKTEAQFLGQDFSKTSIEQLSLHESLLTVLKQRIDEIQKCLYVQASLSVIFLCGSSLEGILLGIASNNPKIFNLAKSCPKNRDDGKPKTLSQWTLADLIDVAHETGFIGLDVKKFGHALRDFRNFIHPHEQSRLGFNPDIHTAQISWKVLQAAINDLGKAKTSE